MTATNPTAAQKAWLERVSQYAEEHGSFPKYNVYGFQLHHVMGRTARHNKVKIGHWFVLPIEAKYHDISSNNHFNVTNHRKRYSIEFGWQRNQFAAMCAVIRREDGSLPFDDDVYHAILDTGY